MTTTAIRRPSKRTVARETCRGHSLLPLTSLSLSSNYLEQTQANDVGLCDSCSCWRSWRDCGHGSDVVRAAGLPPGVTSVGRNFTHRPLCSPLIFISTRAAVEAKKTRTPPIEVVLNVLKTEGIAGLYSGLSSSLLGIAITNFVYYGFYEQSKEVYAPCCSTSSAGCAHDRLPVRRILRSRPGKGLHTIESIIAGLIAGSATSIISNPIWVVQVGCSYHSGHPRADFASDDSSRTDHAAVRRRQHISIEATKEGYFGKYRLHPEA